MKDKVKIVIAVVAVICIIVFSVVIATLQSGSDSQGAGTQQDAALENEDSTQDGSDLTASGEEGSDTQADGQTVEDENTEADASASQGEEEDSAEGDTSTGQAANSGSSESAQRDPSPVLPDPEESADDSEEETQISFPYTIPNTSLVIENIASYDGIFLEDGSDASVTGIYSMVLENSGDTDVEYARITLNCDDSPITFEVSDVPSGATVVAQEINKTSYQDGTYSDCSADVAESQGLEQSEDLVSVQENSDGSLTVSNLTDNLIPCVRIFYKFYMSDENAYVGGITYTAKLVDLEPGADQTIVPSHYSQGYSRVVMVRTYDTSD